jgi:hypothetical protein
MAGEMSETLLSQQHAILCVTAAQQLHLGATAPKASCCILHSATFALACRGIAALAKALELLRCTCLQLHLHALPSAFYDIKMQICNCRCTCNCCCDL